MDAIRIYWGGDLFDHKDLIGNLILAKAVFEHSNGRYQAILPQDSEENSSRSVTIRDKDLELLFSCDVMVANFDGHDLDSGTVVEFCYAKMLDMPTVLFRSDFRFCGDGHACSDPWNLMCSGYPRTTVKRVHGMKEYHDTVRANQHTQEAINQYYKAIALDIISALDETIAQSSWLGNNLERLVSHYMAAAASAGASMPERFTAKVTSKLIESKLAKGIY